MADSFFIRQESARNVVSVKQEFRKKFLQVFAAEQTLFYLVNVCIMWQYVTSDMTGVKSENVCTQKVYK